MNWSSLWKRTADSEAEQRVEQPWLILHGLESSNLAPKWSFLKDGEDPVLVVFVCFVLCLLMGATDINTLEVIKYQNVSEELKAVIKNGEMVSGDNVAVVCAYQDVVRDWIEIYQLYKLYSWNYRQYKEGLCVEYDGSVGSAEFNSGKGSIDIEVNGYVANLISAGRNLADSMEAILKAEMGDGSIMLKKYKQVASRKYDKKQAYYFLYELRNYVQHGQTVVSTRSDGGKVYAYFDLGQLREPAHFSAKAKIAASMTKWAHRIEELNGPIRLSLGHYVEEYNYEIRDLFLTFLDVIRGQVGCISKQFFRLLKDHPSYVHAGPDGSLFVAYRKGKTIHLVDDIQQRVDGGSVCERETLVKKDCRKAKKTMKEWNKHRIRAE